MTAGTGDPDLARHLEELRKQRGDMVRVDDIGEVVQSLLTSMQGDLQASDLGLYAELEALATYIQTARAEIAALRPDEVKEQYINSATDELDAIVGATEAATHEILDAAEQLEQLSADLQPEHAKRLMDATTRVYEACNFQDITGQRITKVVKALKHIEERVEALVAAFGGSEAGGAGKKEFESKVKDKRPDADLLNGPQLPDDASTQAEIDALLASFD